jgi:PAS domain S-box-containing protein
LSNSPSEYPAVSSLQLTIPPDLLKVSEVRRWLGKIASSTSLDEARIFDLQVAVSEAVANVIEHVSVAVEVEAHLLVDRMTIEITNDGAFRPPVYEDHEHLHRGLGLPLMASLADEMCVAQQAGGKTRVSLTFFLDNVSPESGQERGRSDSAAYARSLLEASLDPLVTISPDGKITDVNEATVKVTGRARDELIGTDFSDYFTDPESARRGYLEVFDKGSVVDYPLTICDQSGKLTDVLYNASLYKDQRGKVLGVFAAARDVTAQRQAAQYARSLLEASLDPLVTISPDGKITDVNEATVKVTGRARDELIGTDFSDYFTDPESARRGYLEVFDKGSVVDYPLTICDQSGKLTDVLYNASLYKDQRGKVLGVFAAARDVTERKRAEETLARQAQELRSSNAELERFAYVASHDLQEPLRMVTSYLQLVEERYRDRIDENGRVFIDYAVDGAARMQQLINGLLTLSRVATKGHRLEEVDAQVALEHATQNLAIAIRESEAKLTHGRLPVVFADPTQLTQLFQNLIANAIKFAAGRTPKIHIDSVSEKTQWLFRVCDNGIGIDMEYAERIFDIFQRLHGREQYPGTGIGLAISKRIVERHGGRIWVESEPGQGSTFFFTLPRQGKG